VKSSHGELETNPFLVTFLNQ